MAVEPKKVTGGAFGRYMAENRAALIKECQGKPATASIKLGSERFKALGDAAKAKYQKVYEDAKKQYDKDLEAFLAAGGEKKARKSKKTKKEKKVKDPNRPKKPAGGAFGCFLAKNRADFMKECAGKPITAITKLASERWKALSAAQKQPFEKDYETKKAAYEKAMKDYVPPVAAADDAGDEEAEDGDEEDEEEEEEEQEQNELVEKEETTKKRTAGGKVDAPAAKKSKATSPGQGDVEAEAKKLGYLQKFKSLAENPKVKSSPSEILEMLQKQNGSVVAAKKALLGAAGA